MEGVRAREGDHNSIAFGVVQVPFLILFDSIHSTARRMAGFVGFCPIGCCLTAESTVLCSTLIDTEIWRIRMRNYLGSECGWMVGKRRIA